MERIFTKTVGRDGRFPAGHRADWPMTTWRQLASSVGESLDAFSVPIEAAAVAVTQEAPPARSRRGRR